jgi:nitrite reductase/ring-hydroxylating ferredoxin subunit
MAEVSPCDASCSDRRTFVHDALALALGALAISTPLGSLQALDITTGGSVRYRIPPTDGVHIDARQQVILCRSKGEIFAFALACPHQNTALRALPGTRGFQCPRHKSRYEPNGTFIAGKATRHMDRLPISRDGDDVVVEVDVALRSDADADRWQRAVVRLDPPGIDSPGMPSTSV